MTSDDVPAISPRTTPSETVCRRRSTTSGPGSTNSNGPAGSRPPPKPTTCARPSMPSRRRRTADDAGRRLSGGDLGVCRLARHPEVVIGKLVLRFARQEIDHAALDALALEQSASDLAGDGHVDPEPLGQGQRSLDRVRAF